MTAVTIVLVLTGAAVMAESIRREKTILERLGGED
jgi:hypothetical protein